MYYTCTNDICQYAHHNVNNITANHDGHHVSFYVSEESDGCCDCGDEESWSPSGNCSKHKGNKFDYKMELTDVFFHSLYYFITLLILSILPIQLTLFLNRSIKKH